MKSRKAPATLTLLPVTLLVALTAPPAPAQAPGPVPTRVALPLDLIDVLDMARFKIRVPANWNGTLLVYLHGTQTAPVPEPVLVPPVAPGSQPDLEQTLLSRGYALAASDFGSIDMPVKEAVEDSLALSSYFQGLIGKPARVILWGTTVGALSALKMIEDYPRAFDGVIGTCTHAAGVPRMMDRYLDFGVAYAAAFGWPEDKWGPLGDVRPNLNTTTDVMPNAQTPKADGSNRGLWEFIRLVTGISPEAFWETNPTMNRPGWVLNLAMTTWARSVNQIYAAGPFAQNLDRRYTLKPEDQKYLAVLGVNADDLLAKMNAQRNITAAPWARDYAERFGTLRGLLRRPVLNVHGTTDNVAEVAGESVYGAQAEWWGCQDKLVQVYTKAPGHCVFTSEQLLAALDAMESWLNTGVRPNASGFPESKGFDSSFAPPPWPY